MTPKKKKPKRTKEKEKVDGMMIPWRKNKPI